MKSSMPNVFSKAKWSEVISSKLRRENEFVAKGGWNGASGFQQRLQMDFGGLLEAQDGLICCSVEPVAQESAHSADATTTEPMQRPAVFFFAIFAIFCEIICLIQVKPCQTFSPRRSGRR
jgi:hypothetical protein